VPALPAARDQLESMLLEVEPDRFLAVATETLEAVRRVVESEELASAIANLDATLARSDLVLTALSTRLGPLLEHGDAVLTEVGGLAATLNARSAPLTESLTRTSDDLGRLARRLDDQVEPLASSADSALKEAGATMQSLRSLTAEGSSTRHGIERALAEVTRAARSVRTLADYLERHPEALLQGKR
jgi:paraquat-inducible protein B